MRLLRLNKENNYPLYKQVSDYILEKIKDNTFQEGDAIPTEKKLCSKLDVSRNTLRRGIGELVHKGYLERIQGNGTFVNGMEQTLSKRNNQIGVILPTRTRYLHTGYLNGIEKALSQQNFRIIFVDSNSKLKKQYKNIHQLLNEGVKGLIIVPVPNLKESSSIINLKKQEIPFVLIDRRAQGCKTNFVGSDNTDGSYQATEYLIKLGHKNIAFVSGNYYIASSLKDRLTGYQEALTNYNIDCNELIFSCDKDLDSEKMYSQIFDLVKENNITGIIAASDRLAIDIIKMSKKRKISIPSELSVIGFDNIESGKHLEIPLTTVAQFPEKIGILAGEMLIEMIKSNDEQNITKEINYPEKLIIRESCAKINI